MFAKSQIEAEKTNENNKQSHIYVKFCQPLQYPTPTLCIIYVNTYM